MPVDVPGSSVSFPVNVRAPADSDSPLASGQLRTAFGDLADRTAYLKAIADALKGHFQIVGLVATEDDGSAGVLDSTTSSAYVAGDTALHFADVPNTVEGDLLIIFFRLSIYSSSAADAYAKINVKDQVGGLSPVDTSYPGSEAHHNTTSPTLGQRTMFAAHVVQADGNSQVGTRLKSSGGNTAAIAGPWSVIVAHVRPGT